MKRFWIPAIFVFVFVFPFKQAYSVVHKIVISAPINQIQVEYVNRAMDIAEAGQSDLVLIVLNTPGGLADAMEQIISRLLTSKVPVCVYVYPPGGRAASAGFFILVSADIAAMAPGTRAGAAHPIMAIGGVIPIEEPQERKEKEEGKEEDAKKGGTQTSILMQKVKQDVLAYLRAIAQRRGRNSDACEKAVTESKSYSDDEALKQNIIDLVAVSEQDLLNKLEGREVKMLSSETKVLHVANQPIIEVKKTFREKALEFITNPNIAFLLFVVGALLIYVEVTHAGMVLPGVVGAILLLLAIMGFSFLPISVTGVLLILLAIGLLIAEVFVQSFGLLGVAGIVCLALGAIMLVDLPEKELRIDPFLAVGTAVGVGGILLFLLAIAVRAFRRKPVTGMEGIVGQVGEALSDIAPEGQVFLAGTYWSAVSQKPIPKGSKVRCVNIKGLTLEVEAVSEDVPSSS
jgi:membrane-bound serine protease (ClpP class)